MKKGMLEKLFGFDRNVTRVRTEVMAGITTFLTMAYILAVNPNILSAAGMDKGALFTTTAVASAFATLLMAFYAKLPFGLAPGMGLNAFFAYTVCLTLGYSWQFALTAVLLEGLIFIVLTVTNLREKIVDALPVTLKNAIGAGIGLFIAFLGLQNAGVIVNNDATLVGLGQITSGSALLALIGLLITSVLLVRRMRGALLFGILLTTLVGIPMGVTHMDAVVSMPPSIEPIFFKFEWEHIFTKEMLIVVFTFLFVDMFDTIGTLVGVYQGRYDDKRRQNTSSEAGFSGRCLRNNSRSSAGYQYHYYVCGKCIGSRRRRTQRIDSICYGSLLSAGFVSGSVLSGCAGGGYGSSFDSGRTDDDVIGKEG